MGLEASFEITPLRLPRYGGEISGLLPVLAINMIHRLMASDPTFKLQSHGRTRINFVPGYTFTYQRIINGMAYWGRYVLITPHLTHDRQGLLISMLTDPTPADQLAAVEPVTPDSVGDASASCSTRSSGCASTERRRCRADRRAGRAGRAGASSWLRSFRCQRRAPVEPVAPSRRSSRWLRSGSWWS